MSEAIEVDIGDLPGVGPATKAKLESGGITTILDLAASTVNELVDNMNLTDETAHNLVFEAQRLLREKGYLEKDLRLGQRALYPKKEPAPVHDLLPEPRRFASRGNRNPSRHRILWRIWLRENPDLPHALRVCAASSRTRRAGRLSSLH